MSMFSGFKSLCTLASYVQPVEQTAAQTGDQHRMLKSMFQVSGFYSIYEWIVDQRD